MPESAAMTMLVDNTLRESEQVPGVGFSAAARRSILDLLVAGGVDLVDLGLPGSDRHWQEIAELGADLPATTIGAASVRARDADLAAAQAHGIHDVFTVFPASEIHLEYKFGWSRAEFRQQVTTTLASAARRGLRTWVVAEDSSRGSSELLGEFAALCKGEGARSLFLCDTVGTMLPSGVAAWIAPALEAIGAGAVGVHCHNDFGMATANTVQAWHEGARLLSCTTNGLGERAGNADTLQVAAALTRLAGLDNHWNVARLADTARAVETASGVPLAVQAPLVGWTTFRHESGIHVDGMLKNESVYEAVHPDDVGARRAFVLGTTSGRAHIRHVLSSWGKAASDELVEDLFWALRELAADRTTSERAHIDALYRALADRCVRDEDLLALIDDLRRKARA
jgi:isopropylmalate/homocitrate/citramalate synthase